MTQILFHFLLLSVCLFWRVLPKERNPSFFEQRLNWAEYRDKHEQRGTFKCRLRMSPTSFYKLLELIKDELLVNETMAKPRGGPIIPELCLYCTLRWLAGGSYLDIQDVAGISTASFYRVVWKTIRAIVRCEALKIVFPSKEHEVNEAISHFASISHAQAITNCVGVVDGFLL